MLRQNNFAVILLKCSCTMHSKFTLLLGSNINKRLLHNASCCKGFSSWRIILPVSEHNFTQVFWNVLCLQYCRWLPLLPTSCVCGNQFSIEHAFGCPFRVYQQFVITSWKILMRNFQMKYIITMLGLNFL